jgi:hypothetical protein
MKGGNDEKQIILWDYSTSRGREEKEIGCLVLGKIEVGAEIFELIVDKRVGSGWELMSNAEGLRIEITDGKLGAGDGRVGGFWELLG